MPRPAKPYLERDWYVTRVGGVYKKLCRKLEGKARASEVLREYVVTLDRERRLSGGALNSHATVAQVFALFLDAVQIEHTDACYCDYQRWLTEFAKAYGQRKARDITRGDANDFKRTLMNATWQRGNRPPRRYKNKTINHALIAVRRAFNWAIQEDFLYCGNPFARIKMMPNTYRFRLVTEDEYRALLRNCGDTAFRDVLVALRLTDARPSELRRLKWSMVDWEMGLWRFSEHKTSNRTNGLLSRVIGMHDIVVQLLKRRRHEVPDSEYVFLNSKSQPWTNNALGLRMRRLRQKAGIDADGTGEQLTMYANRRTFGTLMATDASIPEAVRTQALGHTDPRTTKLFYLRLKEQDAAEATRKVAAGIAFKQPTAEDDDERVRQTQTA
jgi:integrase